VGWARSAYGRQKRYVQSFGWERKERDHLEDISVDGRIILRWIFKKWDGGHGLD